jgi:uncharacterized protein (DUF4415 family)
MEFHDDAALPDKAHFTEHGELRFYEKPKPKFVFYNPKAKKPEIVCYSSSIRTIANCLSEAQAVARAYLAEKKSESQAAEKSEEPIADQTSGLEEAKTEAKTKAKTEAKTEIKGEDLIFCRLVSEYGDEILIKNNLQVSVYNDQPRIWLKPWWRKAIDEGNVWLPSNAGFQFSIFDSARNLVAFADRCIAEVNVTLYGKREKNPQPKPKASSQPPQSEPEIDKDLLEWFEAGGLIQLEPLLKDAKEIPQAETASAEDPPVSAKRETGNRRKKLRSH